MSDINRRFSKAQWTQPPGQFNKGNDPYLNANNSNHSFNVNQYYQPNKTSTLPLPSSESVVSTATNATNATRRRFSVKLNQSPLFENGFNGSAPPLPFNASTQIYNSSNPNLKDVSSINSKEHDSNTLLEYNADMSNNHESHSQQLLNMLSADNFDVTRFIHMKLSDATAARIDDFAQMIDDASKFNEDFGKGKLAESISRVLAVSNAINETHNVLNTLKPKINDLNESLAQQLDEANEYLQKSRDQPNSMNSVKVNRQSLMILQNKWTSNMKKLYSEIDKAHDLLPPLSTRHIVLESRRWGELNSITCKPIRPAHIVVLNDSILIASRIRTSQSDKQQGKAGQLKTVRNVATYCWMIENVCVEKGSQIKELSHILDNDQKRKNSKSVDRTTLGTTGTEFETVADTTLCIRTIDTNQTYLFQTDLPSEFIRVFNSIQQTKTKILSNKRKSIRDSVKLGSRLSSSHAIGITNGSVSNVEKQVKPDFEKTILKIDDLLTSVSLELGLKRFEECIGYFNLINEEQVNLGKIAIKINIPKALLKTKHFSKTESKTNQSVFAQHVHLTYHMKATEIDNLKEKMVAELLHQISSNNSNFDLMKSSISIFKALNREQEAAETYLDSRGRELEECAGMVRLGGGGIAGTTSAINTFNPRSSLNGSKPLSRSASAQSLVGQTSRPVSVGGSSILAELDKSNNETAIACESKTSVISELVTAYIRELSLVYMGFISRVWDEWNQLFVDEQKTSKISNVRVIEWVNECIVELKHAVALTLMNYERDSNVFVISVNTMKEIFDPLKEKELNLDYLLKL